MPELKKLNAWAETLDRSEQEAALEKNLVRSLNYVELALTGVPDQHRRRFDNIPVHDLLRERTRYFASRAAPVAEKQTRPRERRARRTARATGSRGDPEPEPPLARPLSRVERHLLKIEVDRRVREGLEEQRVRDKALFRAVAAWGEAGVVR